jgi:SAM-dependent methyltransferase
MAAPAHQDQVRALFDTKAAGWPGKYGPDGRLTGRLNQFAGAVLDLIASGGDLLDLGCASGELARHLAAAGYRVTGCDIAPQMLRLAAAADPRGQVRWVKLDPGWRALPFETGSLDAVIASSVLEYLADPATVLSECARVLRPGGTLLCTVPDQTHPVRWLERPLGWTARTGAARAAGRAWPRLGRYLTYLRVSRQRRPVRWWQASAGRAGLRPAALDQRHAPRGPLRILALTKPVQAGGPDHHDIIGGLP